MSVIVIEPSELKKLIEDAVDNKIQGLKTLVDDIHTHIKNDDTLLSPNDVQLKFGASLFMQAKWRREGLVNFERVGVKKIFYRRSELDSFFKSMGKIKTK